MSAAFSATPSETMKAVVATGFGAIDENIYLRTDWPKPFLPPDSKGLMIIRVLACALAPGDVRVLSGKTDWMQLPKGGHPYVIGSDTSGIVNTVSPEETGFQVGDYVVARFDEPKPQGGVAEYRLVKTSLCEKCPDSISPIHSCGLTASSMAAKKIVEKFMKPNDRVLVIGGSGAVGSSVIQYAKLDKARFIAAVSTQEDLCRSLGADKIIDYRKNKWWKMPEFHENDTKFDVVFDLVNGDNWIKGGCSGKAVKRKGKYVALLTGVETEVEVHGVKDVMKLMFEFIGRFLYSRLNPRVPKWVAPEALELKEGDLKELLDDVQEGRLKPILDVASPFEFSEEGLRKAMALQKSIHAHGKVVIKIADA
jgi:NADPH:quinone reductase-like Zn-dependent oxidoreductase